MTVALWVVMALGIVFGLSYVVMTTPLFELMDAPPRRRRQAVRRSCRAIGLWQLSLATFLVMFDVHQGEALSSLPSALPLGLMGLIFVLVPWIWVPSLIALPGEKPDLTDPVDVERWLRED